MRTVASFASLALGLGATGFGLWRNMDSDEKPVPDNAPAAVASEAPDASPVETAPLPSESPTPVAPEVASCSNLKVGYALDYPFDWFTASNNANQDCRFFDDRPVTVAQPPANTEAAIVVTQLNVAYQDWVDSYEQPGINIIERFDTTVGGLPTTVTEFTFVDDPSGSVSYVYDIDHDGVLAMFASNLFSDDFELTKQTLDAMAASLVFQ